MKINGKEYRSIWWDEDKECLVIIDQRELPWRLVFEQLHTPEEVVVAIRDMHLRGAPVIGIAGAYGVALAIKECIARGKDAEYLATMIEDIRNARPTAVNLATCVDRVVEKAGIIPSIQTYREAIATAHSIYREELEAFYRIGEYGFPILQAIFQEKKRVINILTHCNAGWLACGDYGTVTSVIYRAHAMGIPLHVWVSETRPRNQGARLTAWELYQNRVPATLIADNASGYLMAEGKVDIVLVGADRVALNGDTANKIGTLMKAVMAREYNVPFYVVLPLSTFDFNTASGNDIPVETRSPGEVINTEVWDGNRIVALPSACEKVPAFNPSFDITPAKYITGFITDNGVVSPEELPHFLERSLRVRKTGT